MKHLIILLYILSFSSPAYASQFSPEGFYDVDYLVLDNGFTVVMKEREGVHNVAVRLAVDTGYDDYPLGKKETPHFLEHLLFTGTSKHTESELDELIESHGGLWNAGTGRTRTTYELDIYSKYALFGIDVLYEIMTDSTISEENVEISRNIVNRELGGKKSALVRWLYKRGIGKGAGVKASEVILPDESMHHEIETADNVTRDDIIKAFEDEYIPNNMTLVVVGDFKKELLLEKVKSTFGKLRRKAIEEKKRDMPPYPSNQTIVTGTFKPLLGTDAKVAIAYRTDGLQSTDYYALSILEKALNKFMYNIIRVEKGLSYSPSANHEAYDNWGVLLMIADVKIKDIDVAVNNIKEIMSKLKKPSTLNDYLEKIKTEILLSVVQGYERNADYSDYYVTSLFELKSLGKLVNYEDQIESATLDQLRAIATKYLDPNKAVIVISKPTLTYTQFYVLIGLVIIVMNFIIWRLITRHFKKVFLKND